MLQIELRFYGTLNDFLQTDRRQQAFMHCLREPASVKDVIESVGVPHPEVDLILVNHEPVDFDYLVQPGDRISVYPLFHSLDIASVSPVHVVYSSEPRFIADVHLGKLVMYLRLLGVDVLYDNDYQDEQIAALAAANHRTVLTCDRALLKRSIIISGYCVRSRDPLQQTIEVVQRFNLRETIDPFQRCLRCNGQLRSVSKATVCDRLPPLTRQYYTQFRQCQRCEQVYWQGAHHERLQQSVDRILEVV